MPEKTGLSGKCSLTVGWSKLSAPLADSGERFAFFALSLMIGRSPRHRACLAAALILFKEQLSAARYRCWLEAGAGSACRRPRKLLARSSALADEEMMMN
jgi:hypothetical protein